MNTKKAIYVWGCVCGITARKIDRFRNRHLSWFDSIIIDSSKSEDDRSAHVEALRQVETGAITSMKTVAVDYESGKVTLV